MAFNIIAVFKSAVDWKAVNGNYHESERTFELYPFSDSTLGEGFGISIPSEGFSSESWETVADFLLQVSAEYPLSVYDMYRGEEIDPTSYRPDGLDEETQEEPSISDFGEELLDSAIQAALDSVEADSEGFIPFVLSRSGDELVCHDLVAAGQADTVEIGRELIQSFPETVSAYALVHLGTVELEDVVVDSVIIELGERAPGSAYLFSQPFAMIETDNQPVVELRGERFILDRTENQLPFE